MRPEPRRTLPAPVVERIVRLAFPHGRVAAIEPLGDGLRNANFKLDLEAPRASLVLRIYEHDASICRKELDLIRLVAGSVPVPEVIHAEPRGFEDLPPLVLVRFVEGITFRELKLSGGTRSISEAAYSAGETLAAIGRAAFPQPGWLAAGPAVGAPLMEGADPAPRFVDSCLASANLQPRMPPDLRDRVHAMVWSCAPELARLGDEARLVHGDFGKRNLLVRSIEGRWRVAAVLDWEFAVSGSPLADLGHFLRYERASRPLAEPHFSAGYLDGGGVLPHDWRHLARLIDLTALCESLTHEQLPDSVVAELVELVRATAENRDPQLP